jgi:peptidoglycan hydrolase-like protein with peptidoglycan-binding domain
MNRLPNNTSMTDRQIEKITMRLLIIYGFALTALGCLVLRPVIVQADTSASDRIRTAQEYLTTLGYQPGALDGIFGPRTEAAIRAFQKDNGLPVDGKISDQLIGAIYAAWLVHLKTRLEALEKPPRE